MTFAISLGVAAIFLYSYINQPLSKVNAATGDSVVCSPGVDCAQVDGQTTNAADCDKQQPPYTACPQTTTTQTPTDSAPPQVLGLSTIGK